MSIYSVKCIRPASKSQAASGSVFPASVGLRLASKNIDLPETSQNYVFLSQKYKIFLGHEASRHFLAPWILLGFFLDD